jgi:hypothetical protein
MSRVLDAAIDPGCVKNSNEACTEGNLCSTAESNSAPRREPGFANRDLREDTSTRFSRSRVLTRPRPILVVAIALAAASQN